MRQLTWTLLVIAALAAAAAPAAMPVAAAAAATASPAGKGTVPGVVLINQPASSVCVGRTFRVGVWYQRYSGGSRAYRVKVFNPRGKRILFRHGRASAAQWKFWTIRPLQAGRYRTVYSGHWKSTTAWTRFRVITRSRRC
jgi:hypothetical protein